MSKSFYKNSIFFSITDITVINGIRTELRRSLHEFVVKKQNPVFEFLTTTITITLQRQKEKLSIEFSDA